DQLDAAIIQPSAVAGSVALFRFREGTFAGPHHVSVEGAEEPLDSRLRSALQEFPECRPRSAAQFSEELAMLKRWYYRTHKTGEIVFANARHDLPVRKIANAATRVHRGEKA